MTLSENSPPSHQKFQYDILIQTDNIRQYIFIFQHEEQSNIYIQFWQLKQLLTAFGSYW